MMAKKKRSTKSTVACILLVMVMYLMLTSTVFAATELAAEFGDTGIKFSGTVNGSWNVFSTTSNGATASLDPLKQGTTNPTYSARTDTVTVTNDNAGKAVITFQYKKTTSTGTATVNGTAATTTAKNAEITLEGGGSFTIVLTSGAADGAKAGLEITNFAVTVEDTYTITLQTPANGSYTVSTTSGDDAVTMTPTSSPTEFSYVSTAGITVSATANSGYKFDRWLNGTSGAVLSYTNSLTITTGIANGETLAVSFIPTGYNRAFTVGANKYYSWEDAMDDAVSSGNPVVLSATSYTLPGTQAEATAAGEKIPGTDSNVSYVELVAKNGTNYLRYIVPNGVTFAIPYDSTLSAGNDYASSSAASGKAAYVLTVNDGTEVVVRSGGTFLVNAKRTCSGTKNQGVTTGNYGKMVMAGDMTIESGGTFIVRGYVVDSNHTSHTYGNGTGSIVAKSGSEVEILFQILNHRGGNATVGTVYTNSSKRIMPITNYSVSNVMMRAEIEYGAHIGASYLFYINKDYYTGTADLVAISGSSNTLFTMSSDCRIIMDYDYATDRMYVAAQKGTVSLENIKLQFSYDLTGTGIAPISVPVNTAEMILPLTDSMQIYAGEPNATAEDPTATVKISNPIKLLPGAGIHVMKNGVLEIPSEVYLYADEDYTDDAAATGWSYGTYRTTLFNAETYAGKKTKLSITEDAAIYLAGTLNLNGSLLQSTTVDQEKVNRIIPTSDTAVLNVNNIATSGTIYELPGTTTDSIYANSDWKAVDGIFVDATEYATFTTTGTYKAVEQDSVYKWYNYKVTYQFQDESGNKLTGLLTDEQNPVYIVGDSTTLASSSLAGGMYVIKGYTITDSEGNDITDATNVTAGEHDSNKDNTVSYGWENVMISNLTQDITVTLTVATYENRVNWTANAKESTAADCAWTDYVTNTASYTPDVDTACSFEVTITNGTDGTTWSSTYTTNADSSVTSTVVVTGIENDINVDVRYDSDTYKVTWNVTDWNGDTTTTDEYVTKGGDTSYNVEQPDDAWYVIASHSVTSSVTNVIPSGTAIQLIGITDTTVVDITLKKYDYSVTVSGATDLTDNADVNVGPFYANKGDTLEIDGSDFGVDARFTFTKLLSCSHGEDMVECTTETLMLTMPDSGAKSIAVMVQMDSYSYKVVVEDSVSGTLVTEYIDGTSLSYTFDSGIYVKEYTVNGTATVTLANPTVTTAASLAFTEISTDVTATATTAKYDHILTMVDEDNEVLGDPTYVSGTSYTYTIEKDDLRYISDAKVIRNTNVGDATLGNVGSKSMSISNITGNPTVQLKLQAYNYTVAWNDNAGNTLQTDYILENQTETSYTCEPGYVAQLVSVGAATGSQHKVTTADNKTHKVANISSNMTIVLEMIAYEYAVTVDDGTVAETWYVKNDEDVLNGGGIVYWADTGKYICDYSLNGTATVDGSSNTNANVTDGWETLKLTDIGSDVTVALTIAEYDYKVTWNVKTSLNGVSNDTTAASYITGDFAEYTLDEQYTITDIKTSGTSGGTASGIGTNVAQVSDITGDVTVSVIAQDYLYEIVWNYTLNGETVTERQVVQAEDLQDDGTVKWDNVPEGDEDGVTYVVTDVTVTGGTATHTNKTVNVKREGDSDVLTVTIKLEEALTNYTALWGNMSFRYYKNGAFYAWDGEAYTWKLIDQYAWTHKSGSMIHSYADLDEVGKITTYTVPNGSVMIVNPTNQKITATVTIEMGGNEAIWKTSPTVTLTAADGTTGVGTITVTLDAHSTLLISAVLEGTPTDNLTDQVTGTCSVKIEPID